MDPDGTDPQLLTDTDEFTYSGPTEFAYSDPTLSPDGRRIAFTYVDFGSPTVYEDIAVRNTDVYTMNSDGSRETRLTHTYADIGTEHDPAWSPSGSEVALIQSSGYYPGTPGRASGTSAEIYVMKSDGSAPTFVRTFPDAVVWGLDWR